MAKVSSRRQSPEVWIVGIATMPTYVIGDGEPQRPEILLWVDQKSMAIVGSRLDRPGTLLGQASAHLDAVTKKPMFGPPRTPTRLRVASPELAQALLAGHPSLEVVCAPTPEIDDVIRTMGEMMAKGHEGEQGCLLPDVAPEVYASFFAAAATLYRARPWKAIPPDAVLSVTVPGHGLDKAALTVMGHLGQSFGFLLFGDPSDFEKYLEAADQLERGQTPEMPSCRALEFKRGAEVAAEDRKTIASQHWPVASPQAYPHAIVVDKDMVARPLSATELPAMEAVVTGLAKLVGEKKAIKAAFEAGDACVRTYTVQTSDGDIDVTFRAPHEEMPNDGGCEMDVLDALFALEEEGSIADEELRRPLEDELCEAFAESPEAKALSEFGGHRLLMELGARFVGASIATLEPWAVREIIFDIVPHKVAIDASHAGALIEDCRAFYRFLERAYGLEQADACLRVLGPQAEARLASALSARRNMGPTIEAGFDMQSKEGIEAWIRAVNASVGTSVEKKTGASRVQDQPSRKKR